MVQSGGVPNDVIMDVGLVHMSADNKSVVFFGKPAGQLIAQAVGLLRGDLAGDEGLPDSVGDHIIGPALPAGLGKVLAFGEQKLRIRNPAVALVAGNEPAAVRLVRILHVVDNVLNCSSHRPAFAGVQGYDTGGCDKITLLELPFYPQTYCITNFSNSTVSGTIFYHPPATIGSST